MYLLAHFLCAESSILFQLMTLKLNVKYLPENLHPVEKKNGGGLILSVE